MLSVLGIWQKLILLNWVGLIKMTKVIGNDFVRLYNDDAIELALDDDKYVQVFYTAKFSKVKLFGVDYGIVEHVDFYKIIILDEYGEVVNDDNSSDYDYYKNVTFDIIYNKINNYDYQKTYKTFSKDFYNDTIAN